MKHVKEDLPGLFDPAPESGARHVFTVGELTLSIKGVLESSFPHVYVEGEISNLRPSSAGHVYFSLKDEQAVLPAALFSRSAREVKFRLEDGLKVVCAGAVEVYPPHGKYQLIVESIEPKGIGALQLAKEQLMKKLEKEGLFSPAHKRPLPPLPARIGIVTSPTGAAIKDILKVIDRRFKDVHIIVCPARVQGEGAKEEIAQAIRECNEYNDSVTPGERMEVLIVGRGGGSIEDLWAFNEEIVARAIYASSIPVISAVGHERDVTIADLVADVRAATPSVAAELVLPLREELKSSLEALLQGLSQALLQQASRAQVGLDDLRHRLQMGVSHVWELSAREVSEAGKKLHLLNPSAAIMRYQEKLAALAELAAGRMSHFLALRQAVFVKAAEKLGNLSPLAILSRGYSITFREDTGGILKDAGEVRPGQRLRTRVHRGAIVSEVKEVESHGGDEV